MKREIKFRGLRTDGKGWVYGSIVYPNRLLKGVWIVPDVNTCDFYPDQKDDEFDPNAEHHGITIGRFLEVIPESVGQFTGLHDKNGSEIYEGDLLEVCKNKNGVLEVEFINAYVGGWVLSHYSTNKKLSLGARESQELEVTGNIHQN